MRPGMQTLLELLRGEPSAGQVAAAEWLRVLELAREENVLPWAAARVRAQVRPLSPEVDARVRTIEREARISAFVWSETLRSTLAEFHRRGVPVIALKGPWLAQRLYGDAALRLYADLDLLVRKADFARSGQVLTGLGFRPAARRDDYARTWSRGGITLELHDDVENPLAFDFGIDQAWERAQPAEFEGAPALLLAPADELRFLCLHGARHRFERLSHMLDLALGFRHLAAAGPDGPDRLLALGWMMAVRLDPAVPGRAGVEDGDLAAIAEGLWQERMREPAPMLDWRTKHQFLVSIERRGWDRWRASLRHGRILATRLIRDDFAFAARFHLYRTWQVWLLRPVRLLLNACQALPEGL
jgi:hypothetical protein